MKYTEEQHEFIRKVAPGKYNVEIAELFNAEFGTNVTESQIKSFKSNHKIKSNLVKKQRTSTGLFTKEQEAFIKDNVKGRSNQMLAKLINQTFNLSITTKQIKTWKANHHLSSGLKGSEGTAPPNKGTKGIYNVGGNKTSFKKGQKPVNYKPVGYERVDSYGYVLVKVSNEGPWHKRWRAKHKVLWEKERGPIPPGHKLLFADQNKQNITLDNLILVSNRQMSTLNKKGLLTNNPDYNRTSIIMAELYQKISERSRK
ncbi:HNH endonuclease signature motif containing protein [Sediminibacillus massiliensis]|uniref:HNH endonuclease signature motif containing protein n=1 Tax=Sediminibacillus massiliensis TaxID=1926277 RepID=UPI0009887F63|nr:HNH endonuclease signature motif containing protein [Sediminibacillus massiliensis]